MKSLQVAGLTSTGRSTGNGIRFLSSSRWMLTAGITLLNSTTCFYLLHYFFVFLPRTSPQNFF